MLNVKTVKKIVRIFATLAMFAGVVSCVGAKEKTITTTVSKKDTEKKNSSNKKQALDFSGRDELVFSSSEKSNVKVYGPTARIIQKALADSIAEKFKEFFGKNKVLGASSEDIKKLDVSDLIHFENMPNGDVPLNDACKVKFSLKGIGINNNAKKFLGLALVGLLDEFKKSGYLNKEGNLVLDKILKSVKFNNNLHKKLTFYSEDVKKEYGKKEKGKEKSKVDEKKLSKKEVDRVIGLMKKLTLTIGNGFSGNENAGASESGEEMSNLQKVLNSGKKS